jgi:hypothetical protein
MQKVTEVLAELLACNATKPCVREAVATSVCGSGKTTIAVSFHSRAPHSSAAAASCRAATAVAAHLLQSM